MFSSSYKSSVTLCSLWTISEDVTNHWSLVKEKHWRLQIQLHENLNVDPWQGKIVRWWDVQFGFWRPIQINNTYAIPFAAEQVSSCFLSQNSRRNGEWSWFILFDVFFHAPSFHPAPLVNPPSSGQGTGTSSAPKSAFFAATSRGIMALPSMSTEAKISTSGAACASSWAAWATRRCTSLVVWLAPKPRTSFGRETMYLYTLYLFIYIYLRMYIYIYPYYNIFIYI